MRFVNLTRHIEIGANSYLLEIGGRTVVIDSGMHPKHEGEEALPRFDQLADHDVATLFLSHAHLDHVGTLPILMRRLPKVPVFMTEPTSVIADAILHNSVNVMTRKKEQLDLPDYPLFTHREADTQSQRWISFPLDTGHSLGGERLLPDDYETPGFRFHHAGHILGAVSIEFFAGGRRVLYTGDINFDDQTIMRGASLPESGIETLIIETTRGDSPGALGWTREKEEKRFAEALAAGIERGSVLVPVFALGKTQEVLAMIHQFKERDWLPKEVPLSIGGLSTKMTTFYDRFARQTPRKLPGFQLLQEVAPYVLAGREAGRTPIHDHRIYAISSGMMTENTLSNLLARRFLAEERHSIFFVGYSDPDSPAGRLRATPQGGLVNLHSDEPDVPRRCHVEDFTFSAHGSRESLLAYILRLRPQKVLFVHGDPPAIDWFARETRAAAPEMDVVIPAPGQTVTL